MTLLQWSVLAALGLAGAAGTWFRAYVSWLTYRDSKPQFEACYNPSPARAGVSYLCTQPRYHTGLHAAVVDGRLFKTWASWAK